MVMYRDYVSDFPRRCSELLRELHFTTRVMGLDVTHLLSITTVGLMVPHERLRVGSKTTHPSGDLLRFKEAVAEYNGLLEEYFLSSGLCLDEPRTWRKGRVKDVKRQAPDFSQAFASAKPMRSDVKVRTVVGGIMRNALAHGNIVTRVTQGREINDIMFLAERRFPDFRFVAVEPEDLHKFMTNYFEFLSGLDLGSGQVIGGAPEAA